MPERSVAAIADGTVIDHLPAGSGSMLIPLLSLYSSEHEVTIGLSLPSSSRGKKDLIKMNGRFLTTKERQVISAVAPGATINTIRNFVVTEKEIVTLPETIQGIFGCPNPRCITNSEHVDTIFQTKQDTELHMVWCRFCERLFPILQLSLQDARSRQIKNEK